MDYILYLLIICLYNIYAFEKRINLNNFSIKKRITEDSYIFLDPESGEGLSGYDSRHSLNRTKEMDDELFKIKKYLELNKILNSLESSKISDIDKLNIIDYNYILDEDSYIDLFAGGLYDDWNFNIIL